MRRRRGVLAAVVLSAGFTLVGCAAHRTSLSDLPAQEYVGHYVSRQGESWFTPCGADPTARPWWVTFTERSVAQADRARTEGKLEPGKRYYVRWKAAVTTGGEVGPQGRGVPALLVRELLDLRAAEEDDCADM